MYRELLLGCGAARKRILQVDGREDWSNLTTLDLNPHHKPNVVYDLESIPLPFEDESYDEIHAYEVLEHVGKQGDWRFFLAQFSDFWRILKPDGALCGSCPLVTSPWAWGDPGHTRVIQPESLLFLDQALYTKEVGVTAITDYRYWYTADFEIKFQQAQGESFYFVLKAIKPSRITI